MSSRTYERIRGEILGRSCLLLDCFAVGTRSSEAWPGEWEQNSEIFVNSALLFPRSDSDAPAEKFTSATAVFRGLAEFDGRRVFKHDFGGKGARWVQQLRARDLKPRLIHTRDAKITIGHGTGSKSSQFDTESLTSKFWVTLEPHQPRALNDLIDLYTQVRNFVALSMHQDCRLDGPITLEPEEREGHPARADDFAPYVTPYEFHAVWARGTRPSYDLYNRVLSYKSMGPEGIARWLAIEDECGHVISRLASLRFSRRLAFEDALLRVVAAADSFHRILTRKDRENAETVLKDLAHYAGEPFLRVVPHVRSGADLTPLENWAKTVIDERHNAAHNKGKPILLPALASELVQSVYWLVFICLLRRANAPDTAFESLVSSQPYAWPMSAIRDEFTP